jgi:RNA polymerase sigma-70 factor (ECF subfamily)
LALALACALETPGAADMLEEEVLGRLRVTLSRLHSSPAFVDEVLQTNLLMPRVWAAPRLAGYVGVGSLFHWVMRERARERSGCPSSSWDS